jgi:hypothetical protein
MLLRGYVTYKESQKYNNNQNQKIKSLDKRFVYNPIYEPIRGSDIFCELPPKKEIFKPDYQNERKYEIYYDKKKLDEKYTPQKLKSYKSYSSMRFINKPIQNTSKNKVYDINNLRYNFNPFKTTYNASYLPNKINSDNLVGINKNIGTGVAYNSKKQKIEFLKSNIFCDRDKYNQNCYLRDNFDPKNINHNNWYTNLDWRNNKAELIFYQDNQKEFYDKNSKANKKYFDQYK